jgi:2-methylcitrate dehydratase PrpD
LNALGSVASEIAKFIVETNYQDLPEMTIQHAKERILDILSAIIAGASTWNYTLNLVKSFADILTGSECTLIGFNQKGALPSAAMFNSALAHSVELDDGHNNAGVHAGAVVIPVALALSEKFHITGQELINSIVLGYDVAYRLATNMCPALIQKGFHPSAICGGIGAVATASKLIRLNREQTANALALSALQVTGLMEATKSGQASKSLMVGHSTMTAILCAMCAKYGLPGPTFAFEGDTGLFAAVSKDVDWVKVVENFGAPFLISDTYVKLYPTCRHIHAAIEGIIDMKRENGFTADDVERVIIGTFPIAYDLTGLIHEPKTTQDARFSMSYCVATSLLNDNFGMKDLEIESLSLAERRTLDRKVEVRIDEGIAAKFPKKRGVNINVRLKDGRICGKEVFKLRGSPDIPIGWDDLRIKFMNCASLRFCSSEINEIIRSLSKIDASGDAGDFVRTLAAKPGSI